MTQPATTPTDSAPVPPPSGGSSVTSGLGGALVRGIVRRRELSIFVVCIAAVIYFSATSPNFNDTQNYHTIAQYIAPWAIIGAGEVLMLIPGQIDLSAGFVFTLSPFLLMIFYNNGMPLVLATIVSLLLCAAIGLVNGLIHTIFGLPAFIVTLGMAFFLEGMSLIASNAEPVDAPNTGGFAKFIGGYRWSEMIWALVIIAGTQLVLSATRFGVYTQATGSNPIGAAEAGIRINRVKIVNFIACSVFAGLGGILDGMRVGSFDPTNGGNETMFLGVASAIIGGTALLGGSGTAVGALLGALLLGIVNDGFNLSGVNANAFDVVLGIAIVAAMILNVYLSILRKRATK
jgi:simple sugar transport system permease protein